MKRLLIEKNIWDEEFYEKFIPELLKEKIPYELIEYIPFDDNYKKLKKYDYKYLFYGSLNLGRDLREHSTCIIFNTPLFYRCTYYYPQFEKYLLNNNYTFLTFSDFQTHKEYYINEFGRDGAAFIKPDSGEKVFTGIVIHLKLFDEDIEFINRYNDVPDNTPIVISEPQEISREFRFLINQNTVITGSQYKEKGFLKEQEILPDEDTFRFAQQVINEIQFEADPLWVIDIAETNNELKLLEIGCFSSCGLYSCNVEIVVQTLKKYLAA